jgi:predicted negative regulator of RcsB-dependent stress response
MIDENLTDDQQAELIKSWWRENGLFLVGGLVLGVGGLFGWQTWQSVSTQKSQEASNAFQELLEASAQQRYNKADELYELITADYAGTPYADSAELEQAARLRRLASKTDDTSIRNIAKLRLGRVLLQLEDYSAAAQIAAYAKNDAYTAEFADLRGDIAYAQGNIAAARTAYEQALASGGEEFPQAGYVRVKLNDLGAPAPVAAE